MTAPAAQHADPFALLEQLRAAAEPLGLVVELRPAPAPEVPTWSSRTSPAARAANRRLIVDFLSSRAGEWVAPRSIAEGVGLPPTDRGRKRISHTLVALADDGVIEHNGRGTKACRYRVLKTSTPIDGDGEAEQAAATPPREPGPEVGRDPSPGDPAVDAEAAGTSPSAPNENRALERAGGAAEPSADLGVCPHCEQTEMVRRVAGGKLACDPEEGGCGSTWSRVRLPAPVQRDLVPVESRGAATVRERVLAQFDQDGEGTVVEIFATLRAAGYARADVAQAVFTLRDQGLIERAGDRGGHTVYRRAS